MGDTKHALICSYCELGFKPLHGYVGWMHPGIKEEDKRDGATRLILCIDKHPEYADKWEKHQITPYDVKMRKTALKMLAQSL